MGVIDQTFVIYGTELTEQQYEDADDDGWEHPFSDYEPRDADTGSVVAVCDHMGGRYYYAGVLIAKTNSTRDGPQRFDEPVTISGVPDENAIARLEQFLSEYSISHDSFDHHIITQTR